MFDTEYHFEEMPLVLGTAEVSLFTGTAFLEGEIGPHDYGFAVTGIALDGNLVGNYRDKRTVRISKRSDDPLSSLLFEHLSRQIEADASASEFFYGEMQDHLSDAA